MRQSDEKQKLHKKKKKCQIVIDGCLSKARNCIINDLQMKIVHNTFFYGSHALCGCEFSNHSTNSFGASKWKSKRSYCAIEKDRRRKKKFVRFMFFFLVFHIRNLKTLNSHRLYDGLQPLFFAFRCHESTDPSIGRCFSYLTQSLTLFLRLAVCLSFAITHVGKSDFFPAQSLTHLFERLAFLFNAIVV